jgi:hypothetical protein
MADIQPGGYWSHTLGHDLEECHRRVYYRVYGSWGGWSRRNGAKPHLLYQAKSSDSLATYAGSLVHEAIQAIIQRIRAKLKLAPNKLLVKRIEERMRFEIDYSTKRLWQKVDHPKRATLILKQHLLGEDLHQPEIEAAIDKAQCALKVFLEDYLPYISTWEPDQIILIDSLDGIEHRGYTLFASPDLVLRRGDEVILIDWKTGRFPNGDQLKVYGWYLVRREERDFATYLDPKTITGRSVPLLNRDKELVIQMDQDALDEAIARVDKDIDEIETLHQAGLDRDESAFAKTIHRGNCSWCRFQFHCDLQPR